MVLTKLSFKLDVGQAGKAATTGCCAVTIRCISKPDTCQARHKGNRLQVQIGAASLTNINAGAFASPALYHNHVAALGVGYRSMYALCDALCAALQAQTNNLWDQITLEARGLVTDSRGQVIGRSSSKFFNQGSRYAHVPADPTSFRVQEKLDGSLGLIFHYHGAWHVASHGSFISRQAVLSAEMLQKYSIAGLDTSLCYACELIHPSNRLIVEYGSQADLVILAAFHRDGSEVFPLPPQLAAAGFPVVRTFSGAKLTDLDTLRHLEWQNAEVLSSCATMPDRSDCMSQSHDWIKNQ